MSIYALFGAVKFHLGVVPSLKAHGRSNSHAELMTQNTARLLCDKGMRNNAERIL